MARIFLNNDWSFTETFSETLLYQDDGLTEVRLPHTCRQLPYHYCNEQDYQMVCGYVRHLYAPAEWEGMAALLTISGAAHHATLYVNGRVAAVHHSGYTAFTTDISDFLTYGADNRIVLRLDTRESLNTPPFGFVIDYLTYGGLYRDVWLEIKERIHIRDVFHYWQDGNLVTETSLSREDPALCLRISLREHGSTAPFRILGKGKTGAPLALTPGDVYLWSTEDPRLYDVRTELLDGNGASMDTVVTPFGFRRAEFRKDGFYLNEQKVKIRGLNRHQSYPYVGYAMPDSMQARDAEILKYELGVNAVRTSHYPQAQAFLDRCDEVGLLVFTEFPGWQHIGDEAWKEQALENLREMIIQYRNHPSIILWGVRINESVDDDSFYRRTNALSRRLDPSRQTGGVRCYKKGSFLEDVYTYNDFVHSGGNRGCEPKDAVTPDPSKPYMVTEYNGHMFPAKSFDSEEHRLEHALRHANVLDAVAAQEDIAGSFGWCMFDYNTHRDFGAGDRICYHGVMDMFRNPKLAASIYASQQEDAPVLAVSSSMDIGEHPASLRGDVYVFTNADLVRVYKNGALLTELTQRENGSHPHLLHSPLRFDESAAADNTANAEASTEAAPEIAPGASTEATPEIAPGASTEAAPGTSVHTDAWGGLCSWYRFDAVMREGDAKEERPLPGDSHAESLPQMPGPVDRVVATRNIGPTEEKKLWIDVDHRELKEGKSYDVAAVRLRMTDENGNVLPFANDALCLEAEGPVEIIGPKVIALQGGMFGTYVKTIGVAGAATLTITDPAGVLPPEVIRFLVTLSESQIR